MGRKKMGRPPKFRSRRAFLVLLEATEVAALHRQAEVEGESASAFVRKLIQKALAKANKGKETR